MSKNKLTFADAIKYMTENPRVDTKDPCGKLVRYDEGFFWCEADTPDLTRWKVGMFSLKQIEGEWTIPEPEIEELTLIAMINGPDIRFINHLDFKSKNELELKGFRQVKIKFNQP